MAALRLRELNEKGRFILATWHHNTKGKPYDQDYMDGTFIQNLIADNVRIGLHGHQHKLEIIREENNIIDNKVMHIESPPVCRRQFYLSHATLHDSIC